MCAANRVSPDLGRPRQADGNYQHVSVVRARPGTVPSETQHQPASDSNLAASNFWTWRETSSRLERLRGHIYEDAGDITDFAEEDGNLLGQIFARPPTSSHVEVPAGKHDLPHSENHAVEGGHVAVAAFVTGVLAYEGFRRIKNKVETRKER
jgi:hypothetical protein